MYDYKNSDKRKIIDHPVNVPFMFGKVFYKVAVVENMHRMQYLDESVPMKEKWVDIPEVNIHNVSVSLFALMLDEDEAEEAVRKSLTRHWRNVKCKKKRS